LDIRSRCKPLALTVGVILPVCGAVAWSAPRARPPLPLSSGEFMNRPDPRWHPVEGNPAFLGVHRWNILRKAS
jgi:hypothetical protein